MATISITIPDALVPRVINAIRGVYPTETTGLTDSEAARAVIKFWVRQTVMEWEGRLAQDNAQTQINQTRQEAWNETSSIS